MNKLQPQPAEAYRRVDLDALNQALLAIERQPGKTPVEPLSRANGIAVWLARSVAPENPLHPAMTQFYGGLASIITRNMVRAIPSELAQARDDFADFLEAAKAA